MGKMLLQTSTTNSKVSENAIVVKKEEKKALSALMQEMSPHLNEAAKDLLQPRPEAIAAILKKALG